MDGRTHDGKASRPPANGELIADLTFCRLFALAIARFQARTLAAFSGRFVQWIGVRGFGVGAFATGCKIDAFAAVTDCR
jgi:hypothetical protein